MDDLSRGMAAVAERLHRAEGMAREYQAWIDFFHAGEGDYADFLRKHVLPPERDLLAGVDDGAPKAGVQGKENT